MEFGTDIGMLKMMKFGIDIGMLKMMKFGIDIDVLKMVKFGIDIGVLKMVKFCIDIGVLKMMKFQTVLTLELPILELDKAAVNLTTNNRAKSHSYSFNPGSIKCVFCRLFCLASGGSGCSCFQFKLYMNRLHVMGREKSIILLFGILAGM